jgi:ERCC4-type nuclease
MPRAAKPLPELPCILKDTREQTPWCFSPAVTWERTSLPTADYSLKGYTDIVCIERKSIADLVMSCASKERERFWESCRRMKEYERRVLIVEGSADDIWAGAYRSQATPRSIMATTLAMHVDFGVAVIWAGDVQQAAWTCEWFLTRLWKLKKREEELAKKEMG